MTSATSGSRAAGRPERLPRAARRAQLLAAAQQVFVARGYHAAAMDDIAECAGVSKPVLYQHFPGKLELYLALLDTHCDALVVRVRQAICSTTDNNDRIDGAMRAYFEFVDHGDEGFRLVFESDLGNDAAVRERFDRMERGCIEAIAATVTADTGAPPEQAELLAAALVGAASAAARFWVAQGRAVPRDTAERMIATVARGAIGTFPTVNRPNGPR